MRVITRITQSGIRCIVEMEWLQHPNRLLRRLGWDILKKGGNAVDAAIATAAALTVVEPTSNGIGGDAFALVWIKDEIYGLNASGGAPASISVDKVKEKGHEEMPTFGDTSYRHQVPRQHGLHYPSDLESWNFQN